MKKVVCKKKKKGTFSANVDRLAAFVLQDPGVQYHQPYPFSDSNQQSNIDYCDSSPYSDF
jgi:hypothetical protein